MKVRICSDYGIKCFLFKKKGNYCEFKLPCGGCVDNHIFCTASRYVVDFDCDACEYRFKCLTNNGASWQREIDTVK